MINLRQLKIQRFNVEASSIIDEARYSIRAYLQLHLFNGCKGKTIKEVFAKLDKMEARHDNK